MMVILSKGEKKQIADMHPDATKYCVYPDTEEWTKDDYKKINEWMKTDNGSEKIKAGANVHKAPPGKI